jgi:hypothetical protein
MAGCGIGENVVYLVLETNKKQLQCEGNSKSEEDLYMA